MAIIYQKNKKTGVTYAYEATSVWVPELKQPRSKRVYLGRVDSDGNIIPAAKRSSKKKDSEDSEPQIPAGLSDEAKQIIAAKDQEIDSLKKQLADCQNKLSQIKQILV